MKSPIKYYPQFPEVILDRRADYRRVTEQFASIATRLAWLNRILIAAISRRINGNFFTILDYYGR